MHGMRWVLVLLLALVSCVSTDDWLSEPGEPVGLESDAEREVLTREVETERPPVERTGNVTVVVEKIVVGRRDQVNLEAAWRYADEHVVAAGGDLARRNGIRVGVSTNGFRVALQAALKQSRNRQVQKTSMTALSGTWGMVHVGEDTYVEALRLWTPGGRRVLLERTFVGSSLVVEPTILPGDKVQVRLHPRFTTRDGRAIDLVDMSTEVVLAHGQPMVIGGLDESSDSAGSALFSLRRERDTRKVTLTLTPYIQGGP